MSATCHLDHLFVWVTAGAPEAARLKACGLTEGPANSHPNQGTACRRFFFHNAYLELLWVHDATEAQSDLVRPTQLWERWAGRARGACPFGFCFRPASTPPEQPPFDTWAYHPPYLPPGLSFGVGTNAAVLSEPSLFWLSFAKRTDNRPLPERPPLDHASGWREISRVELISPHAVPTPAWQAVLGTGVVQLRPGNEFRLEIGFDREFAGQQADLRPELPLILHW